LDVSIRCEAGSWLRDTDSTPTAVPIIFQRSPTPRSKKLPTEIFLRMKYDSSAYSTCATSYLFHSKSQPRNGSATQPQPPAHGLAAQDQGPATRATHSPRPTAWHCFCCNGCRAAMPLYGLSLLLQGIPE